MTLVSKFIFFFSTDFAALICKKLTIMFCSRAHISLQTIYLTAASVYLIYTSPLPKLYMTNKCARVPKVKWLNVMCTQNAYRPYYYFTCSIRCCGGTMRRPPGNTRGVLACTNLHFDREYVSSRSETFRAGSPSDNYVDRNPSCPAE